MSERPSPDGPPFDLEAPDAGLAAERTDLAWDRSGLALLACGAAVMRGLTIPHLSAGRLAVGMSIVVLGGFVCLLGGVQRRRRARRGRAAERATIADLAPVAIGTAAVGTAVLVICTFFPR